MYNIGDLVEQRYYPDYLNNKNNYYGCMFLICDTKDYPGGRRYDLLQLETGDMVRNIYLQDTKSIKVVNLIDV